jgi:RHS repeat-associated protein
VYEPDLETYYTYSYDANGNMVEMVKRVGEQSETTEYEYDYENRMTHVTLPNSSQRWFTYDGDKRRISTDNGTVLSRYFYDGINILKDYNEDWEPIASYTQGIGIDKLISRTDGNGIRYYHADALGSTRLMTDGDEDTVATYVYDAWGKLTSPPNQNDGNKFKFTAREFEDEIGLQYNRARFYDPETGRFITQDPLTKGPDDPTVTYFSGCYAIFHRYIKDNVDSLQPDKTNRYVYCYNNPINLIDPLGLSDRDPNEQEIRPPDPAPTPPPQTQPTPPPEQNPPSPPQEGQTAQDVKETIGLEKKDPLQFEKNTMPLPEPVPKPSPEATATLTPRQGMTLKNANLTYDQVLNQNNRTAQELHETLQPTGRAADIIQWVSIPFLFVPATAPAAAVAVSASSYAGLIAKLGDAAVTKDPLKAAGALGELALPIFYSFEGYDALEPA